MHCCPSIANYRASNNPNCGLHSGAIKGGACSDLGDGNIHSDANDQRPGKGNADAGNATVHHYCRRGPKHGRSEYRPPTNNNCRSAYNHSCRLYSSACNVAINNPGDDDYHADDRIASTSCDSNRFANHNSAGLYCGARTTFASGDVIQGVIRADKLITRLHTR